MPAPKKAEEKPAPKAAEPEPKSTASEGRDAPPAPPPPSKVKEKKAPPAVEMPDLRPRQWFDHILPNSKGEGFMGFFTRERPKNP